MEIKQDILDALHKNKEITKLAPMPELETYLKEEFRELDLSKAWDTIPTKTKQDTNPNNILLWYLLGLAPMRKLRFLQNQI